MKTPAVVAVLTVIGSLAFAAGRGDAPLHFSRERGKPDYVDLPRLAAAAATCDPAAGDSWFVPEFRPISGCMDDGGVLGLSLAHPPSFADVNGDGVDEYFRPYLGIPFIAEGAPKNRCFIARSGVTTDSGKTTAVVTCILTTEPLIGWVVSQFPDCDRAYYYAVGWRDMDNDNDLDLVLTVSGQTAKEITFETTGWFENIGYEKPNPPLAADLNGDGWVDGADLGLLLGAWGARS
jgi:hypothetical protein